MQPTDHMSTRGRREDNDGRKGRQSGRWMEKKTKTWRNKHKENGRGRTGFGIVGKGEHDFGSSIPSSCNV
jgi:hypothetical protein